MPDTKITALTAIGANPIIPATFPIPMVDLTDTSMAASGTTKKVTVNQILGAGGTATLASATITGALTVNGISNFSGAFAGNYGLTINNTTNNAAGYLKISGTGTGGGGEIDFYNGATAWGGIKCTSSSRLEFLSNAFSTLMTLNSTGLGVGVVPSAGKGALQLSSGINFPATQVASSDANTLDDYVEGSWVPTLNSGTFSSASCRYTKIGNMVTIFFDVTVGTGGGDRITNLPFAAASTSTVANGIYTNNQTYAAGTTAPVVVVGGSSSTLFFRTVGTGVAFSAMTFTAAANLTGSISYFV